MIGFLLSCIGAGPAPVETCPQEMRAVTDGAGEIQYCIDAWEVRVEGSQGDRNQLSEGARHPTAVARSAPGVTPTQGVSWGQARAICANTPALDAQGRERGRKRLPTVQEWLDAGDGVLGAGGSRYPYGDAPEPGRCACGLSGRALIFDEVQLTGALAGCTSAFGVADLSGNLWEWADPELSIDLGAWWSRMAGSGLAMDAEGYLHSESQPPALPPKLVLDIPGVRRDTFAPGADGYLGVSIDWKWIGQRPRPLWGFLLAPGDPRDPRRMLPVRVLPPTGTDRDAPVRVRVQTDRDGQPLAQKIGGAYYTGSPDYCPIGLDMGSIIHPHDFVGTIGFRCVAAPLSEDSSQ